MQGSGANRAGPALLRGRKRGRWGLWPHEPLVLGGADPEMRLLTPATGTGGTRRRPGSGVRVDGAEGSTGSDVPGRMAWAAEGPHGRWPRTLPPKARGAPSDPADTGRGAGGPQKATSHADSRTSTRPGLSAVTSCCLSPPPSVASHGRGPGMTKAA